MGRSTIQETLLGQNPDYGQAQVYLSLRGSKFIGLEESRLPAIMTGEFSISAGSAWNTPFTGQALEGISQSINMGKATVQSLAQAAGYNIDLGAQIQLKSLNQTVNFWTGSERPVFSIDLLYIALTRGTDVRKQVLNLYKTVMPSLGEKVLGLDFLLNAPLGYNPVNGAGTFSVQIGKWFRARAQVMKSVNFTYSQEMVPLDGDKFTEPTKFAPLYAKGSITFEPYMDITYGDFAGYFIGA